MQKITPFASKLADREICDPEDSSLVLAALRAQDLPLVRVWLNEAHVRRWYGPPETELAHIAGHIGDADPYVSPFLAIEAGRPIGYLQIYHANVDPCWAAFDVPRETFGTDMLIPLDRPDRHPGRPRSLSDHRPASVATGPHQSAGLGLRAGARHPDARAMDPWVTEKLF